MMMGDNKYADQYQSTHDFQTMSSLEKEQQTICDIGIQKRND